jgi:hypothetical protein
MTAWLQKVYDAAKSSAAPIAAAVDPDKSAATSTTRPQAAAAVTTEARFSATAGSARVTHRKSWPRAKYNGYPSRGVMSGDPTVAWNDPVSPKSKPGSIVAR